jgi:hypothetical protein
MRKTLLVLALAIGAAGIAFAHPPAIGSIGYDPATRLLTVEILHDLSKSPMPDPTKHFVKEVDVSVNGAKAVVQSFLSQESPASIKIVYRLVQVKGDKLSIQAHCSIFGTAAKEYSIP